MSTPARSPDDVPDAQLMYETPQTLRPGAAMMMGLVGLRLIGFYLLTLAAASLPQLIYIGIQFATPAGSGGLTQWNYVFIVIAIPLMNLILGVLILTKSGRIAGRLFRDGFGASFEPATLQQTATLLVAAVGLLVLVLSVSPVLNAILGVLGGNSLGFSGRNLPSAVFNVTRGGAMFGVLAQPAIGLYLLLRADRVATFGTRYMRPDANVR